MSHIVIANWKIYLNIKEQVALAKKIAKMPTKHRIILAPSFLALPAVAKATAGKLGLAGQDMTWADYGAYTGGIAGRDLKSLGCQYVLLGHSERRKYFNETNEIINKKILLAQKIGLTPVLCLGESAEEKKTGRTAEIIKRQIKTVLNGSTVEPLIIAYDPIWAIGTDNPATPDEADKVHKMIKKIVGENVSVLYGGSVDSGNSHDFLARKNINGLLVGRASLNPKEFALIVKDGMKG